MRIISLSFILLIAGNLTAQRFDSLFVNAAIIKLQNSKEYTLKMAELMPAEKYTFKPVADEMTFGGQLLHIAANLGWLTSSYIANNKNPVTKEEMQLQKKEDIVNLLNKVYDFAIATLQQFDPDRLADTVSFFAGPKTKLQIVNLISDHQTHHRAQVIVYLRLNGIKPPDYVGW